MIQFEYQLKFTAPKLEQNDNNYLDEINNLTLSLKSSNDILVCIICSSCLKATMSTLKKKTVNLERTISSGKLKITIFFNMINHE